MVAAAGAGAKLPLELIRAGKKLNLEVTLGEMPRDPQAPGAPREPEPKTGTAGMTVAPLTPELRGRLELPASVQTGVVITGIEPQSPAARAGLRRGDVVVEVDGKRIDGVAALQQSWAKASGATAFVVWRQGATAYVVVQKN